MSRKALKSTNEMCSCPPGILQCSLNRINSIWPPYREKGPLNPLISMRQYLRTSIRESAKILTYTVVDGGTQREYSSKPLKHSIVKRILVFKR